MNSVTRLIVAAGLAVLAVKAATAQTLREIPYGLPSKSISVAPPRVAEEMGLFAKHGLKPNFIYIESTAANATALIAKSVEFAVTETTSVIAAAARDQNLQIISRHYTGLSATIVLSTPTIKKLGVSPTAPLADRLKALNNLLISGTSAISSPTIAYKSAAAEVGATPRFTYMAIAASPAALESGAVDGSIMTSPWWTSVVLKGAGSIWLNYGEIDPKFYPSAPTVTAVAQAFAAANPELVRKVIAVYDELNVARVERPNEVKAAYAKIYPELDAKTLDLIFELEAKAWLVKSLTPADITNDIAFMKNSGGDFGPVERVNPASMLYSR